MSAPVCGLCRLFSDMGLECTGRPLDNGECTAVSPARPVFYRDGACERFELNALDAWVPSNRVDSRGRPTHVDGWNEYIRAQNKNRYVAAAMERENVGNVAVHVAAAMREQGFRALQVPALVRVTFVEVNRRRDLPNVFGGLKWVLDGITRPRGSKRLGASAIVDDSQRWIEVDQDVEIDRKCPGVRIRIEPLEASGYGKE